MIDRVTESVLRQRRMAKRWFYIGHRRGYPEYVSRYEGFSNRNRSRSPYSSRVVYSKPTMSEKTGTNSKGFLASVIGVVLTTGFLAAAGSLAFFSWMSDEMLEGDTARFDEAVRSGVHSFASPAVTTAMKVITFFGSTIGISIGVAIVLICVPLDKTQAFGSRFRRRHGRYIAVGGPAKAPVRPSAAGTIF